MGLTFSKFKTFAVGGGGFTPPAPSAPELSDFVGNRVGVTNDWVGIDWGTMWGFGPWTEPSLPPADRTLYPVLDITLPPQAASYYGWSSGYPVCIRAHPAGVLKDITPGGSTDTYLKQRMLNEGIAFINTEMPHPGVQPFYLNGNPVGIDDCGRMIQFIRSLASAFGFDVTKLLVVGQSRGNWLNVTSMRPTLKDVAAGTFAGRQDSFVGLHLCVNSQSVFDTALAFTLFCNPNSPDPSEAVNRAGFYLEYGNPTGLISPATMIATAPQVPVLVTNYDDAFPGGKVDYTTIEGQHWPQSGQIYLSEYYARGLQGSIAVWDASQGGGAREQMGAYAVTAAEYFRGANIHDALATGQGRDAGHSVIAIRSNLAGLYQDSAGATPATTLAQPIGGVADLASGVLNTKLVAPSTFAPPSGGYGVGTPGGQTTSAQRTTLAAAGSGYGFAVVATQRILVAYAGTSNDSREGRIWLNNGTRLDVPSLLPAGAIGFGTSNANNQTMVLCVAAPLGTSITDQHRKVYDFAAYRRRNSYPTPTL